jgi:hypothetical protein
MGSLQQQQQQQQPVQPSALETAGLWSRISFSWVGPLIHKGWHSLQLERDDARFLLPQDTDAPQLSQQFEAAYSKLKVGCTAAASVWALDYSGAGGAAAATTSHAAGVAGVSGAAIGRTGPGCQYRLVHRDGLHLLAVQNAPGDISVCC